MILTGHRFHEPGSEFVDTAGDDQLAVANALRNDRRRFGQRAHLQTHVITDSLIEISCGPDGRSNVLKLRADLSRHPIAFHRRRHGPAVGVSEYEQNLHSKDSGSDLKAADIFARGDVTADKRN